MRIVRHRGKWAAQIESGKRYSTGLDATPEYRDAAEQKGREIIAALQRAAYGNTVNEIMLAYVADIPNRTNVVNNPKAVEYARRSVRPFFGHLKPDDITRDMCRNYTKAMREQGKSDSTIKTYLDRIKTCVMWDNPQSKAQFETPAATTRQDEWLTREQFRKLLDSCGDNHHTYMFLQIAIATAAREEAILGLRYDTHINFERDQIWLGFKAGGKRRATVPMTKTVRDLLWEFKGYSVSGHVVEYGGKPIKSIRRSIGKVYNEAGIKLKAKVHGIRHSAAMWMINDGASLEQVKEFLGHSSIAVTEHHYAKYMPEYLKEPSKSLDVGR